MTPQDIKMAATGRLDQLKEYRQRYSKSEYPRKVAINLVYAALANEQLLAEKDIFFQGKLFPTVQQAAQAAGMKREQHRQNVIGSVEDKLRSGSSIGVVNIAGLRQALASAERGDADAIENLEFSFVYYTTLYDCIWAWAAHGLSGADMMQASGNVTGVFFGPANFQSPQLIEKMFYSTINPHLEGLYKPLPKMR
jgi:hypothetical protein